MTRAAFGPVVTVGPTAALTNGHDLDRTVAPLDGSTSEAGAAVGAPATHRPLSEALAGRNANA